jgi:hypothetical protein
MLASQRFRRGAREPLAQSVEHLPFKQGVAGSNPARLMFTTPESTATVLFYLGEESFPYAIRVVVKILEAKKC